MLKVAPGNAGAVLLCCCAVALSFAVGLARATTQNPPDVHAMQRHIDDLEARLQKLEKSAVALGNPESPSSSAGSGDAASKQRMSEIEARLEARFAELAQSRVVQAPFVVVDNKGRVIVTIDAGPSGKGSELIVGDPKGQSILLYARTGSAFLNLVEPNGKESVALSSNDLGHGMYTREEFGSTFVGSLSDKIPVIQTKNKSGLPVVEMKTLPDSQSGFFTLTNASGTAVVSAGLTNKGTGSVKTGPAGNGAAAQLGNAGKAASEIQGRAN